MRLKHKLQTQSAKAVAAMNTDFITKAMDANHSKKNDQITSKRESYLAWEDYFMNIAFLSAMRSKDINSGWCVHCKWR